jgi:carbonic anhydrase
MTDPYRRRLLLALGGLIATPSVARAEEDFADPEPPPKPKPASKPPTKPPPEKAEPAGPPGSAQPTVPTIAPEAALARLMAGNARYAAGMASRPNADAARRAEIGSAARPFAVILACADSRVAPEIIFDQGLGDLYVIRVAGNVIDDAVLASIEYAVLHLGVSLVMALGHERCGAVAAALDALAGRGSPADRETLMGALTALIAPAVRAVPPAAADRLDAAVNLNAANAAAEIFAGSRPLRAKVLAGALKIVAARYDLDDGRVTPTRTAQT